MQGHYLGENVDTDFSWFLPWRVANWNRDAAAVVPRAVNVIYDEGTKTLAAAIADCRSLTHLDLRGAAAVVIVAAWRG